MAVAEKSLTPVRIFHTDQLEPIRDDLTELFEDYLKRSGEIWDVPHQWRALLLALADRGRILFLVAVGWDDLHKKVKPVGYALVRLGFDYWGVKYASVLQVYARSRGVIETLEPQILAWAKEHECQVLSGVSKRNMKAAARRFRMTPYAVTYVRILGEHPVETTTADTT